MLFLRARRGARLCKRCVLLNPNMIYFFNFIDKVSSFELKLSILIRVEVGYDADIIIFDDINVKYTIVSDKAVISLVHLPKSCLPAFLKASFENAGKQEYMNENSISHTDRVMVIIEKNFKNLNVSQIAEKAHCDSDYLNRFFKSKLGITLKHYLVLRKLAEAQKLLSQGKSVKETCRLAGYNDYSNFLRIFKKHLGYTPWEFEVRRK